MGSSKKHKEKDRDREEKRHKHKDKDRDRDERKHRHKDKDRDKDRDRSRSRSRERDKDRKRGEEKRRKRRRSDSEEESPIKIKHEKLDDLTETGKTDASFGGAASGGGEGMSLSIEETNKLRIKLGLKPLEVTDADKTEGEAEEKPYDKRDDVHKPAVNLAEQRKKEEIRRKMELIREKRKINQKLNKVKSLTEVDADDELDNAFAWVQKSRKIQKEKEIAAKRAKMLAEMDEEFGIGDLVADEFGTAEKRRQQAYTATNLRGLTVQHSKEAFQEGRNVILTLKDKDVLEEEDDDVLINVNIIDHEKAAKNVELKKKKPVYNPYEEQEFDEFGIIKPKKLLSKYDEEIEGEEKKSFTLGGGGGVSLEQDRELQRMRLEMQQNAFHSLDVPALSLAKEYYTQEEMTKFKKPKKRRKVRKIKPEDIVPDVDVTTRQDHGSRSIRGRGMNERQSQHSNTDGDQLAQEPADMDVDLPNIDESEILGPPEEETNIVIEDDAQLELHIALEKSRRVKQKKSLAKGAEKVAKEVTPVTEMDTDSKDEGLSIVLNATSEFCRTLGEIPTYGTAGNREQTEEEMLDFEKDEDERNLEDEDDIDRQGWSAVDLDAERRAKMKEEEAPILEDEPQISSGIAGALLVAGKKGYLDNDPNAKVTAPKRSYLEARNYTIEDKNHHEVEDKYSRYDKYRGPVVDFKEKEGYKPEVKVDYHDETGRSLNQKEAFRVLSHRFHGKGSGKMKTEKRNKKLQEEMMMRQMSSTDTPLNTVARLQEKQKQLQTPFLVLSGGGKTLEEHTMIKK
ncbi:U4/U6.U5 tri-snRNP-associated protein 1-like isoform X2 [Glandiceps talaboti]